MKNILFIVLLFSGFCLHAQTLDEYLKLAVDSNPGLKAQHLEFEAALQKIPQVKSLPDPGFSVSAFGQMVETRVGPQQAIFMLNQMFPWFGTLRAQGNVMALMAEAKFQAWLDARNELFYKVKSAWYPLYELEQVIQFQQENKTILETYKNLALSQFKNGNTTMVDVIRVDIMLEDITTEIQLLEDKRIPLLAQFNLLLNRDPRTRIAVSETPKPDASLLFSSPDSISNNPKLAAIDKEIQSWQAQAIVAKKQGLPNLGVGLNYIMIGKRTDANVPGNGRDAIMPMVSLSLPIYRKKYKAAVKESVLMQSALSEMKREVRNELIATHEMVNYELQKSIREYELYSIQMEKTKQATSLLMKAYSNTGKDFEEVLRMQQLLLKYEIETAGATKNYFIAIAQLDYLTAKNN